MSCGDKTGVRDLRGMRVLVAEDSPAVAGALQILLQEFGMLVIGPVATIHGAEELLAERPQLAVVDMHLGSATGYGLVVQLRALDVPVLAISGSAELPAQSRGVVTLQKPFSGQELLAALSQLARSADSRVAL
jgi:DNA-binding response OmpR family regulator